MKRVPFLLRLLIVVLVVGTLSVARNVAAQGPSPLPAPSLTGEWIAGALYILLLLMIEYVPKFAVFWDSFAYKREVVAAAGLLTVIALIGLHYAGAFNLEIGPFGWDVIGQGINTWLGFLGGSWLIWSLLDKAGEIPRKRVEFWQKYPE